MGALYSAGWTFFTELWNCFARLSYFSVIAKEVLIKSWRSPSAAKAGVIFREVTDGLKAAPFKGRT